MPHRVCFAFLPTRVVLASLGPAADQHSQIRFCRAAFLPLLSQFGLVPATTLLHVQNLAFVLLKFYATDQSCSDLSRCLWKTLCPLRESRAHLVLVLSVPLLVCIQLLQSKSLIKILSHTGPIMETWRTSPVTGCQPDAAPFPAALWALLPLVLHPAHFEIPYLATEQLVQKDAVRESIKSFTKILQNCMHHLSLIHWPVEWLTLL